MNDKTVPAAQPPSEPSVWADIADELERIAADCRTLVGEPAPAQFELNIQPGEATAQSVDRVAAMLIGAIGKTVGGMRTARGWRGPVSFSIYRSIPGERDAELDRLREENARLRAAAGLDHSRDGGPVDAAYGVRVPPHLEDGRNPGQAANDVCGSTTPDGPCQFIDGHVGEHEHEPWNSSKPYAERVAESMEYIPDDPRDHTHGAEFEAYDAAAESR